MNRFVCIHGHFYQPPRENPWLDEVEVQDSAFPYHDWNERVGMECYARNASARILDSEHKITDIVNNYSRISFNFGPSLLSWMERKDPETYRAILDADRLSLKNFNGHGAAMAQVYNHMIMPLANAHDKRTQVLWGIEDFQHRFKRKPEGMWLAETAVDAETLDIMAEAGILYTVLAPHQAQRVKKINEESSWIDAGRGKIDTRMPYLCRLPSGRSIHIFFYDGSIAQNVAFEGLLSNGEFFAQRLAREFSPHSSGPQLIHTATDGETYGHHHKFGDMALAYCLYYLEKNQLARLTVYGEFLTKVAATHEVEIRQDSSWSCMHGVERWRGNCGCSTGGQPGWHQKWRAPLRGALDWLREAMIPLYEQHMSGFTKDVWGLRDGYIRVILDRGEANVNQFFQEKLGRVVTETERIKLIKLLEMQRNAQLMYTSCGWFFNEISGLETVQILKYAARAIQLAQESMGVDLETDFIKLLQDAPSNVPNLANGSSIYMSLVVPSIVDLLRVGAHYAVTSLFEQYPSKAKLYSYSVYSDEYSLKEAGRLRMAVGRASVRSSITGQKALIHFAVLHLGDHNFIGGVDYPKGEDFDEMRARILSAFGESNIPEVIGLINYYFGRHNYSLWHLFKEEQQKILNQVLKSTMGEIETSFRQIYEHHYPLMQINNEVRLPLPRMLMTVVEFVLNRDLCAVLDSDDPDVHKLKALVEEMKRWSFKRDHLNFAFVANNNISRLMTRLNEHPKDIVLMKALIGILRLLDQLGLELDLWRTQNIYFAMSRKIYPDINSQAGKDALAAAWVSAFEDLGDILKVNAASVSSGVYHI